MKVAQLVLTGVVALLSTTALANTIVAGVAQKVRGEKVVTTIEAKYVSCAQCSEKDFAIRLSDSDGGALVLDVDLSSDVGDCGDFPSVKTVELQSVLLPRLDEVLVKDWDDRYRSMPVRHDELLRQGSM